MMASDWPDEIRLRDAGRTLTLQYSDGSAFDLPAEYLRAESPSAEVKGHGPGQEALVSGKRNIRITSLDPVGTYAVRIIFDDGHSTGLYTWDYLAKLARDQDSVWKAYLQKLAAAGLGRG